MSFAFKLARIFFPRVAQFIKCCWLKNAPDLVFEIPKGLMWIWQKHTGTWQGKKKSVVSVNDHPLTRSFAATQTCSRLAFLCESSGGGVPWELDHCFLFLSEVISARSADWLTRQISGCLWLVEDLARGFRDSGEITWERTMSRLLYDDAPSWKSALPCPEWAHFKFLCPLFFFFFFC